MFPPCGSWLHLLGREERVDFWSKTYLLEWDLNSLLTHFVALDTVLNAPIEASVSSPAKWGGSCLLYEIDV